MNTMKVRGRDRSDYPLPSFYNDIYKLVDDPSSDSIISWNESNNGFIIRNQEMFISSKIYSRFYCISFEMFISEVKRYGFEEIKRSDGLLEFSNENFVRGQPVLMTEMHSITSMKMWMDKSVFPSTVGMSCKPYYDDYDDDVNSDSFKQFVAQCLDAFGVV